jgi:hypothetical protein
MCRQIVLDNTKAGTLESGVETALNMTHLAGGVLSLLHAALLAGLLLLGDLPWLLGGAGGRNAA